MADLVNMHVVNFWLFESYLHHHLHTKLFHLLWVLQNIASAHKLHPALDCSFCHPLASCLFGWQKCCNNLNLLMKNFFSLKKSSTEVKEEKIKEELFTTQLHQPWLLFQSKMKSREGHVCSSPFLPVSFAAIMSLPHNAYLFFIFNIIAYSLLTRQWWSAAWSGDTFYPQAAALKPELYCFAWFS